MMPPWSGACCAALRPRTTCRQCTGPTIIVSYTAIRIFTDMQKGIVARFNSMPVSRSAVLWGHVLTSPVSNAISLTVIVLIALVIGFRSSADVTQWLAVAGILGPFTLALTWLAVIPGVTAKSIDGAAAFSYPLIFLPFISSAFVPTDTRPAAVRAFAENRPEVDADTYLAAWSGDAEPGSFPHQARLLRPSLPATAATTSSATPTFTAGYSAARPTTFEQYVQRRWDLRNQAALTPSGTSGERLEGSAESRKGRLPRR